MATPTALPSRKQIIQQFIKYLRIANRPLIELKTKLNIAIELRDNIETLCSGPNYITALQKLWPVFKQVLQGEPAFGSTSVEHVSCL
jgi:hypothetical protein